MGTQRFHLSRNGRIALIGAIVVIGGVAVLALRRSPTIERIPIPLPPATAPSATAPATRRSDETSPVGYIDLIREKYPAFPTTQPLGVPVDYSEAARIVLDVPVYLSPSGDLWITHPRAPPASDVLAKASEDQLHVIREKVALAFWNTRSDQTEKWNAELVVRDEAGGLSHLTTQRRREIPPRYDYDFSRAFQFDRRVVVPSAHGVSLFDFFTDPISEDFFALPNSASTNLAPPQVSTDGRGLLAWRPWENGRAGSPIIGRFLNGKWSSLPAQADKLVHLVPLLDGSLLHIAIRDDDTVNLVMSAMEEMEIDLTFVHERVAQLSDPDDEVRSAAFEHLRGYGSGLWPVLEKLIDDQPPEAQVRLRQLLAAKTHPTLGGMRLLDGKMRLVNRSQFGGALFYASAGVSVPAADGGETFVTPAWISMGPGRPGSLLPHALVRDVTPQHHTIDRFGNEWILNDPVLGPRRFMGNHFVDLLTADERARFNRVIGIDRRGRWLFAHADDPSRTLIVDPTFRDPTPKLPVWTMTIRNGAVGWTSDDWPVIRRGGAWALRADGWEALDETKTSMITDPSTQARVAATAGSASTTQSAPLCVDQHGCRFYDGRETLRRVAPDGSEHVWPLPAELTGGEKYEPALIAADGALFLFNQPGRVAQLVESSEKAIELREIFTRGIPNVDKPARIWRDPAGRINIVHDGNQLHVLFPNGKIPDSIRTLMPADEEP